MTLSEYLSAAIILIQLVGFFIVRQQIASKNQVIESMKVLVDATDIKRLSEYYKATDLIREKFVFATVNREIQKFAEEFDEKTRLRFDEMATLISEMLLHFPIEERAPYIKRNLPNCEELFEDYLNKPQKSIDGEESND